MNRVFRALLGGLFVLLAATTVWAQATAQINGTVTDASGGVLPGVTVTAIQTDTGFRREVVTDDMGSYVLTNLPIGPYRLEVALSGFRTYAQTGYRLIPWPARSPSAEIVKPYGRRESLTVRVHLSG